MDIFNMLLIMAVSMLIIGTLAVIVLLLIKVILKKERAKILLVDDQPAFLDQLKEFLEERNFQIYTASTVDEAMTLISNNEFDHVILDLEMSTQNIEYHDENGETQWGGIELFKCLKDKKSNTQIIILSGHPLDDIKKPRLHQYAIEMRSAFIFKADPNRNYILAILDKLSA